MGRTVTLRRLVIGEGSNTGDHVEMADRVVTFEVESYLARLRVERGLAASTIVAYTRDLAGFVEFADRYGASTLMTSTED